MTSDDPIHPAIHNFISRQKHLTAKRVLKANLKSKVGTISLREPDELKKISAFYDTRGWLKAYFEYVSKVSKVAKKNTSFRSSKNRVFMQFFDVSTSMFIDVPNGAWDTVAIKLDGRTLNISAFDRGSEELYDRLNEIFVYTPLITELERLRKVAESVLGLPLASHFIKDNINKDLSLFWVGPRTADVNVSFKGLFGLSPTNAMMTELWSAEWRENSGTYGVENFEGDTLEEVLDQLPEEFDSDLIFFTDREKLKAMVKEVKSIFPKVKIKDESYLKSGLGRLELEMAEGGKAAMVYKEQTKKWEVVANGPIIVNYVDAYNNKTLERHEIPWSTHDENSTILPGVFEKSAPSQLKVNVSGLLGGNPLEYFASFDVTNLPSKNEAIQTLRLWAKWLETVRTMPFPIDV